LTVAPMLLSQTGLYGDFATRTLANGIVPYEPRYPLWSDGAAKTRLLFLPPGTQIDTADMDNWVFPVGTKVWKEFRQDGVLVETRLVYRVGAGAWWLSAYVWRADGTDADASAFGVRNALGTTHDVPPQLACLSCHMGVRDTVIGVSALELSGLANPDGGSAINELVSMGLLVQSTGARIRSAGSRRGQRRARISAFELRPLPQWRDFGFDRAQSAFAAARQ
jgi:hypothetical protein